MRKKMLITVLAIALTVGIASAALISYFGQVKMTVTVGQSVLLDGKDYTEMPIEEAAAVGGGEAFCKYHWLKCEAGMPVAVHFETTYSPALADDEIVTTYTTTVTESSSADDYYDDKRIMVLKQIGDMTVTDFLALPLEYTVNVISNALYAPNICFWMTDGVVTYVVEAWGKGPEIPWATGLQTVTIQQLFDGTKGYEVTVDTDYGQANRISSVRPGTYAQWLGTGIAEFIEDYGTWTVITAEVRAQAGAAGGQVLRPVQFKAAGETMDIPDLDVFDTVTLQPKEMLSFYICYSFDPLIQPGTYIIYSTVEPAP